MDKESFVSTVIQHCVRVLEPSLAKPVLPANNGDMTCKKHALSQIYTPTPPHPQGSLFPQHFFLKGSVSLSSQSTAKLPDD